MLKNKEGMIRAGWKIAAVCIMTILLQALIITLISSLEFYDQMNKDIQNIILSFVQCICYIAVPFIVFKNIYGLQLCDMGIVGPLRHIRELLVGLLLGTVTIIFLIALIIVSGGAKILSLRPVFSWNLLTELFVFTMVGIGEEILFRGYVISELKRTKNPSVIVYVVSMLLFSTAHLGNEDVSLLAVINLSIFGFVTAFTYCKTGNILLAIGFHITWNYFQTILGFAVSGLEFKTLIKIELTDRTILNGNGFGPEGGICATFILLSLSFLLWTYYNHLDKKHNIHQS